jgi:hypothetical protein
MANISAAIDKLRVLESRLVSIHDLSPEDTRDALLVLVWLTLADLRALPATGKAA